MNVCAVDIGTTSVKAMMMDGAGRRLAVSSKKYPLMTAPGGIAEQDARLWHELTLQTVCECTQQAGCTEAACLCISCQGGSTVPVDEHGEPLAGAATWMDTRAEKHVERLLSIHDRQWFMDRIGRVPGPESCTGHILSFSPLRPAMFLTTLEYVNMKLTGRAVTDPTSAAMTDLFDVRTGDWQEEILAFCGINETALPQILPTGTVIGTLKDEAAKAMGLDPGTPVVNGGHDQYCAAAGADVLTPGDVLLSTGSAWVVFGAAETLMGTALPYGGPHVRPGVFGVFSCVPTGGVALDWVRTKLIQGPDAEYDALNRHVLSRMGRDAGLFVRPRFYTGQASIEGLGLHHDACDIALAAMEGVVFEARSILDLFVTDGGTIGPVKLIGGAAKAESWRRIICAVFGEVRCFTDADVACAGAAAIGGAAVGLWPSLEAASHTLCESQTITASAELRDFYGRKYEKYRKG